jgi:hypothetical protein
MMQGDRSKYVQLVTRRLESILAERESELPARFKIVRVDGVQSDWKLAISIDPEPAIDGWYDYEELFKEIAESINEEFKGNRWYFGIEVRVPLQFLGELGAAVKKAHLDQDLDNSRFRSVRLQKGPHDD